jgi:hypothetical protein
MINSSKESLFWNLNFLIVRDFWMVKIWPYFYKSILQFLFVFQFLCHKSIFFKKITLVIIHMDFVDFAFRTSKLKSNINYIKYKFSHRFGKVCRWLEMYYSKIKVITFFKVTTMSIWIILKKAYGLIRNVISIDIEPLYHAFIFIQVNLKTNMGMNVNIHCHYGWMIFLFI